MAKSAYSDWSATAADNTDVGGISLAEGVTKPSDVNNAIREMMAQLKTAGFISSVLTTPQINDTSSDHQYVVAVSELTADRTVTLPLLTGNDSFVFEAHTQTLTNKTLTTPTLVNPVLTLSSAITPTAEGDIRWHSANNYLVIGDGAGTQTFLPIPASTAAGDIEYYSAANVKVRLAKGTDGHILTLASGLPSWAAAPSSGQPVPTSSTFAVGTLIFAKNSSGGVVLNGSTAAGSGIYAATSNATGVDLAPGGAQAGTWKNVTGITVSNGVFGYFVRTA